MKIDFVACVVGIHNRAFCKGYQPQPDVLTFDDLPFVSNSFNHQKEELPKVDMNQSNVRKI